MKVTIAPTGQMAEVKSIEKHHKNLDEAYVGDHIGFCLKGVSVRDVSRGFVVGDYGNEPC